MICSLSVTDIGIRHSVMMAVGEEFTIIFSGHRQKRHAIRCVVTGCRLNHKESDHGQGKQAPKKGNQKA